VNERAGEREIGKEIRRGHRGRERPMQRRELTALFPSVSQRKDDISINGITVTATAKVNSAYITPQWFSDLPLILTAGHGFTGRDMRSTHCCGHTASLLNATELFTAVDRLSKADPAPLPRLSKAVPWPRRRHITT
jgi:hypothetical protein